ncbi:hypothetical protein M9H77_06107 [Catharanthus roseus]|uniref:Uncharacterized protein n=1 Tax=Catharanthus roseus TaxID=4058 RepID=A0ACC0BR65_CATRO|nr:hypothetical protein M9H77_06107 [Catharanthus roseus]
MARSSYYTNNYSYYDYLIQYLSFPIHFFFFIAVLFIFLIFTWYINYEYMFEDMMIQLKFFFLIFPVVLLLVVHWLSSENPDKVPFVISLPEKESLHRVGGSPLGVGLLLIFLLFMISHHTSLQERWFPLLRRR